MAATYNKYQQFMEDTFKGVHNFTSDATCTVTVALSNTAGDADATKATLSQITQVSYTNCSSRVVTGITAEHTTGTVHLTGTDLVLTASGGAIGPFRYVIFYNDDPTSPADPLMCWFDYGSAVTINDGETFTIDLQTDIATAV
jgi:hypothetical protein